jgi:hypothetical protein
MACKKISFQELCYEDQLLLSLIRSTIEGSDCMQAQGISQQEIDWDIIVENAERHFVLPILNKSLSTLDSGSIPKVIKDRISTKSREITLNNLKLSGELLRILDLFNPKVYRPFLLRGLFSLLFSMAMSLCASLGILIS